ncbi:hypothetical protein RM844_17310 [Streptomyces sp. DSM 44915]|uniref:ATP-binding protein n=1 Tax=Streptomyces chisholmiae TaxID=3075540 RepID=A0ABU2JSZ1_9ACTN|nr:hypothetical protein [Streptomyces sp. DSM 44915]MDT0268042.1 hypothetical protein [Streptomyces sp. DSM 44915]
MVATRQPVFERETAIRGVHALMRPGKGALARGRRPVVFFEGGPGSGKSLLLRTLDDWVNQHVPYARVDFAASGYDEIPRTLVLLAERLARYRPRYRRLRFPRLLIALLVIEQDLDGLDFERAREALRTHLKQRRGARWPERFLRELLGEPPEASTTVGGLTLAFRLPLQGIAVALAAVFPTFPRRSQHWFGHRDLGRTDHELDTLVELNRWAEELRAAGRDGPATAARDSLDALLTEAFLADLRDVPRRVRALPTPLLLLDNVDTPAGRAFLGRLLDARPPLEPGARAEPLTVVATGRLAPPELSDTPHAPLRWALAAPAAGEPPPAWLRYRIPDLARADIQRLLGDATPRGAADRRLVRLVHEFTAGHPEAVGALAAGLAARAARRVATDSVAELLAEPAPAPDRPGSRAAGPTVEEWLVGRLLPDADGRLPAIARCAAGRTPAESLWLSQRVGLAGVAWPGGVEPWDPSAGAGSAVLGRLLRRRLAAAPADWRAAHAELRAHCEERADLPGQLYHRLALGESRAVALELVALLPRLPGEEWLALVREVAAAPPGPAAARPRPAPALFHVLLRESADGPAGPDRPDGPGGPDDPGALDESGTRVTHLLAALRVVGDPLSGSARELLHTQIAQALAGLASHSPDGLVVFDQSVRDYRAQAQWWS